MGIEAFCTYMKDEMTAWKAKTYDLIRKVEKMPPDSDGNRAVAIDEMGAIFDKIEQTIGKLEKECPVHWESEKAELDQMICDIRERWSEASEMSPDDFDG
jgi:hypothetical protein